ncbi:MAG TPA: hypothetical protein VII01_08095, partial [Solirubrobacteraceae bacterium]
PASASLSGVAVLNGPEDEPTDWFAIDWQTIEQDVRRLRQRIFTCLLEPDAVKVASPAICPVAGYVEDPWDPLARHGLGW